MPNKMEQLQQEYHSVTVPDEALERINRSMDQAVFARKILIRKKRMKRGLSIAAAVALFVAIPNLNGEAAAALEKIPVLGKVFEAVTFRNYQYYDGHNVADVKIPEIKTKEGTPSKGAEAATKNAQEYIKELTDQFKSEIKNTGEGYSELDVDYEVIKDTDTWFTLKLNAFTAQASGYERVRYYNVDKTTDTVVELKDLFLPKSDYVTVISDEIKSQMRKQMKEDENKIYFLDDDMPESDFKQIKENQNFYFDQKGQLVIAFDEYEVAPGYMGAVTFTIPDKVITEIKK